MPFSDLERITNCIFKKITNLLKKQCLNTDIIFVYFYLAIKNHTIKHKMKFNSSKINK